MRLLRTGPYRPGQSKLELIEKWGQDIPPYAILSHTWFSNADDEVLFCDVRDGTYEHKKAFPKVLSAMERAVLDGYGHLWIDTCCIDKTSSVELSEAINSMYKYYEDAEICYAFLADVSSLGEDFEASRWWRRGWTLQELLAPNNVQFFSADWNFLGNKMQLQSRVSQISGIDVDYLAGTRPIHHASIASRMFWASFRQTTREEDIAYCLMGLFGVNMPMLYGEGGRKSFLRLREEIMKISKDQSIFAWIQPDNAEDTCCGLLANSPRDFKHTGSTIPYSQLGEYIPFTMTARGLHATLPLTQKEDGMYFAALQCPVPGRGYNDWLAVYLKRLSGGSNLFARVKSGILASCSELGKPESIYVRQHHDSTTQRIFPYHFFQVRKLSCCDTDISELADYRMVASSHLPEATRSNNFPRVARQPWSDVPLAYKVDKSAGAITTAILFQRQHDYESFILILGSISEVEIAFDVLEGDALESLETLQSKFAPRRMGSHAELKFHSVHVRSEERVHNGQKFHFIEIEIRPVAKPETMDELLAEAVGTFVNPPMRIRSGGIRGTMTRLREVLH